MKNQGLALRMFVVFLALITVFGCSGGGGGSGAVGPKAPSGLAATASSSGSIDLAWTDGSDNEDGFKIERSEDGTTYAEVGTTDVNAASYSDTGLTASTKYVYRVRAHNSDGDSDYSNTAEATTLAAPTSAPAAPSNLTAVAASSTAVDLAWTDNADNEEGFRIERSASATSGFTQVAKVAANSSSYNDGGLTPSTAYYYRVVAYNSLGDSGSSNTANATTQSKPGAAPAAPSSLTAAVVSHSRVDLAWTDNSSNEDSFTIERSPDGASFTTLKTLSSNITAHSDTGLSASTTYYYRVKASNSAGSSAYSNTATALTHASPDTDGDGLSDDDEMNKHHTNPLVVDTDGDGWSDFDEIVTLAFNPDPVTGNPYSFNPHLADVPKIGIKITSPPTVDINYTTMAGSTKLIGTTTTRSTESAKIVTQESSGSNTHTAQSTYVDVVTTVTTNGSVSSNGCASVTAGANGNVDLGLFELGSDTSASSETCFETEVNSSLSTSMEARTESESTTNSSTFSWSKTQAEENRKAFSDAETYETSNTINTAQSGGTIAVTVDITNEGQMTFIPAHLVLSAVLYDPADPKKFIPVGNLTFDGAAFPGAALAPGASATGLVFKNATLSLAVMKKILQDPKGLVIKVATHDELDKNGASFNFNMTTINQNTATVVLDYGGVNGRKPERYLVATNSDSANPGVAMSTVMQEYLRIPYVAGTGTSIWNGLSLTGLRSVRDVNIDAAKRGYWMIVRTWFDPAQNKQVAKAYNLLVRAYDFDAIKIYAGNVLHVMFVEDKDKDGLNSLEEKLAGSSDSSTDTDGDGLTDYFEVKTGWVNSFSGKMVYSSPAMADADGDTLNDLAEKNKGTDPWNPNTDGDGTPDNIDPYPVVPDGSAPSIPQNVTATGVSGSQIDLSWSASTDSGGTVAKYKVYEGATFIKEVTTTSASVTGLGEYTSHCYSVTAVDNTTNESSKSSQACATTKDATPPTQPSGLTLASKSETSISFTWTGSTDNVGVLGYWVYRNGTPMQSVAVTSFADSGLAGSTNYCYWVYAYDAAGYYVSSTQLCVSTSPKAPTNLSASWNTFGYMVVTWTDNSPDETGFSLQRAPYMLNKTTGAYVCAPPPFNTWTAVTSSCSGATCKDSGVVSGGSYCYKVRAYRIDAGTTYYSGYSNTVSGAAVP